MRKKQRLVAVHVSMTPQAPGAPLIRPVDSGESLEQILETFHIVQIQPLGASAEGDGSYAALLLLEEAPTEAGLGRLGFGGES